MKRLKEERRKSVQIIRSSNIEERMVARAEFRDGKIIQDRIRIIDEVLSNPTDFGYLDKKEVIDSVIDFRIECWKRGFGETTFNYTINYGAYPDGEIALIDIGELTESKKRIKKMIEEKKWLSQWSYFAHTPSDLKGYFREQMARRVTKEKLDEVWEAKT